MILRGLFCFSLTLVGFHSVFSTFLLGLIWYDLFLLSHGDLDLEGRNRLFDKYHT